jgi:hypothetical protein
MSPVTAQIDGAFVAQVRAALTRQIHSIVDEAEGDAWRHLQHRHLAERIKALVAGWRCDYADAAGLLGHAARLAAVLQELQGRSGLFTGGDNVDSPPDSAFSVNDLADALLLLRRAAETADDDPAGTVARRLTGLLEHLLAAATPALINGGVHTPNHRWELSAALARLHRLSPAPALADRVDQWLAEGVDIDDGGLYSERSAIYAAHVSNPSLLTLAEVFQRPDLVGVVERNLDATLDLLLPDGSVETVMSRRQDQRLPVPLAAYLLPLRQVALLRGRGDLAWAAELALAQGIVSAAEAAARMVLDPGIALALPASVPARVPRQRVFGSAGLLVDHRPTTATVVFGGSDYPRHGRVRSGLANSPTFLRLFAGAAVLDSARLSRTFFGRGPFRSDRLIVEPDLMGATTVTLTETVAAAYYQPLMPQDYHAQGHYGLVDEGRFSAAMDFDRRARDEVTLTTTIQVALAEAGVELTIDVAGAVVDWALELAFRPGGTMTGARALGEHRWQLDTRAPADTEPVSAGYRVGNDAITVALVEVSDGHGGLMPASSSVPTYEPGEEYRFLGGTDAATGELLYLAGRVPGRVRLRITADPLGPS